MIVEKDDFKWVLLVFVAICFSWTTFNASKNRQHIKENYEITRGKIIDFHVVGVHQTKYISYDYTVGRKRFRREINLSDDLLDSFVENNPNTYEKYCFWVIYDPEDPKNSLINMEITSYCDSTMLPFNENTLKGFR